MTLLSCLATRPVLVSGNAPIDRLRPSQLPPCGCGKTCCGTPLCFCGEDLSFTTIGEGPTVDCALGADGTDLARFTGDNDGTLLFSLNDPVVLLADGGDAKAETKAGGIECESSGEDGDSNFCCKGLLSLGFSNGAALDTCTLFQPSDGKVMLPTLFASAVGTMLADGVARSS